MNADLKRSLLAIDVGNTATSVGLFELDHPSQNRPKRPFVRTISSPKIRHVGFFAAFLQSLLRSHHRPATGTAAIVSSVVPQLNGSLKKALFKVSIRSRHFVSARLSGVIKIRYKNPREVGADRIVNARGALAYHSGSSIVIDFGTATTFDCVTGRGEYLGGVIAPGPVISAEALYQKTAKLPHVVLKKPDAILGQSTTECIRSGLYYGYRGLVKEITRHLKKKLGSRTKVIATGGQAQWILNGLDVVDRHAPLLTLEGLYHIWRDQVKKFTNH